MMKENYRLKLNNLILIEQKFNAKLILNISQIHYLQLQLFNLFLPYQFRLDDCNI